ncbi:Zinc finger protein 532 [Camelus dromedarius]|uniref:Zinc finger protein 532 n=1 Tax=Camelus dromedarius TaxID=9838 RepID=A0A5N4DKI4_CAMDR|nr:Zinc finger protein 532 [Camelus dromedarius]
MDDKLKENSESVLENRVHEGKLSSEKNDTSPGAAAPSRTKPSSRLSSCIAVITALSAKQATSNSKGPVTNSRSTPAITKVRIKTIKTSSGEIKGMPWSLSFPSSLRAPVQSVVITSAVAPANLTPKQVTIKPVVTAFLLVTAVKTVGLQVINVKLTNNTMVKDMVISAASIQSTSSTIIKAANATQQQTVVVLGSSLANAKLVKVESYLQSSVVEAFNKVLSRVNPVPVCIPNLSPPANMGIML